MDAPPIRRVLIVAGGTGGHLYPGISIAHEVLRKGRGRPDGGAWEVTFAVRTGDMGKTLLEREGFKTAELPGQGLPRRLSMKTLSFPIALTAGFFQARDLLRRLKPSIVVGMGGYLSFPVLAAARLQRLPTLIHEQNVYPGLANRLLAAAVSSVAVSFAESKRFFPARKVWVSGLPVRPEIGQRTPEEGRKRLNLAADKFTFLVFGGSLGARRLNRTVSQTWPLLVNQTGFQILHVTGELDFSATIEAYRALNVPAVVVPYCHDMASALAAADFVICRAGASTVAEIIMAQRPALLVPFPFASENHQFHNAQLLVRQDGADLMMEADLSPEKLAEKLVFYLTHADRCAVMRRRLAALASDGVHSTAAQLLADYITGIP